MCIEWQAAYRVFIAGVEDTKETDSLAKAWDEGFKTREEEEWIGLSLERPKNPYR